MWVCVANILWCVKDWKIRGGPICDGKFGAVAISYLYMRSSVTIMLRRGSFSGSGGEFWVP